MELVPLGPGFGVEVRDIGLIDVAGSDAVYRSIRATLEEHSVLLFREQEVTDEVQAVFSRASDPSAGIDRPRQSALAHRQLVQIDPGAGIGVVGTNCSQLRRRDRVYLDPAGLEPAAAGGSGTVARCHCHARLCELT